MIDRLTSVTSRIFFAVSGILMIIAIWDWIMRLFGLTLSWVPYQPVRLLEISVILIIFVIALLVRQIREEVKKYIHYLHNNKYKNIYKIARKVGKRFKINLIYKKRQFL